MYIAQLFQPLLGWYSAAVYLNNFTFSDFFLYMGCKYISYVSEHLLIKGVFSVGGRLSLIVIRKTVIDKSAEIPKVTFSPDSEGT